MKNKRVQIIVGSLFLLCMAGLYIYNIKHDLPGTDDNASSVIGLVAPHYKPWATSVGPELSVTSERILFGLQMLGGAVLFAVCYHLLKKSAQSAGSK